jgi:Ser/Thr protein kinase RdoA (MazF antagonist)
VRTEQQVIGLRLMKEFYDGVDEEGRSPLADALARRWFPSGADVRCEKASANFVFRVSAEGRAFYVRFNHAHERSVGQYAAELRFVGHLADRGVPVARPVRSRQGLLVETVRHAGVDWNGIMLEAVPGESPELSDMTSDTLRAWGRAMGEMHNASQGYSGPDLPHWRDHSAFARRCLGGADGEALGELEAVDRELARFPEDARRFGVIHFDMEADNIKWQDHAPGIFDFDSCARYPFAADVAYALRDIHEDRIDRVDLGEPRLAAFVLGYRERRDLRDEELRLMPLFVRAHNLYSLARLRLALADEPQPDDPGWVMELRSRCAGIIDSRIDGFARHPVAGYI